MKALWQRIYKKYVAAPDENKNALLHDRIYSCCHVYIERGCITSEELKNLEYLYNPYHMAGGNGTAKKMYSDCKELPLK